MHVLDDLERFAKESLDPTVLTSVADARAGLGKLIGKLDTLEPGFDRIAERSRKFSPTKVKSSNSNLHL